MSDESVPTHAIVLDDIPFKDKNETDVNEHDGAYKRFILAFKRETDPKDAFVAHTFTNDAVLLDKTAKTLRNDVFVNQ